MTENNFKIESATVTDKGLSEKRPQNEDSYLEMNERGLFAVADGVGGAQAGDVASQMAVEILAEAFVNLQKNGDAEDTMKIAITRANEAIFQMSQDLPQLATMATTIVGLHIAGNIATIGHVGDSRLYRLDPKGALYRETQDHSVVEEEVRAGRLTAAQAVNHPSRNVISRALGADFAVEVDMKTMMFEPVTTFLLCSDGITRHIDDVEIRDILLSNESASNIVQKLKEICYKRGAEDNLTAVIARVTDKAADRISTNGAKMNSASDYEESTITAARPKTLENAVSTNSLIVNEGVPTQPLQMPLATETPVPQETVNKADVAAVLSPNNQDLSIPPSVVSAETVEKVTPQKITPQAEFQLLAPEEKRGSAAGKLLSSLLLLVLGGLIGAGAYHLWAQNSNEVNREAAQMQPTPQPTTSVPYAAFEGSRRSVDRNPANYLETNVLPPEKAEDFYLRGRAYLLTGKYAEAKKAFEEAKNRLAQTNEADNKVLANEIGMGLAIINDPFAQKAFEKDVQMNNTNANIQTNSNSNANSTNFNSNASNSMPNANSPNSNGR